MLFYIPQRRTSVLEDQTHIRRYPLSKLGARKIQNSFKQVEFLPALILFSVLLFQLWIRIENISVRYDLEKERSLSLELDSQLRQLRLDYAYTTRHNYLKDKAQIALGLVARDPKDVRILSR